MEVEAYLKRDYIRNLISQGKRVDGRKFDEYRKLEIIKGYVSEKCCGSALVNLGNTKVLVGVSMDVGEPYPDAPEEGVLTVSAELRPVASSKFELGPPDDISIEIARVVDRGIREAKAIELEKMFIEEGKVWIIFVDIHVLDYMGNLIDASGIAAISALLNTKIPKYEDDKIVRGEFQGKLPLREIPIPCTTAKISNAFVFDPNLDEEYAMDSRLTVTTTDTINAMQKGNFGSFTEREIFEIVENSFKKADELRRFVISE
ncbi:MAG: exosome complex protein Rrp42 [Candidatus Altiarchaeota archaeon]